MTLKDIQDWLQYIRDISGDNEAAHVAEDGLFENFIEDIAQRKDSLGEKARLVLKVRDIKFFRWCA
jgi:hypothetical protein